MRKDSLLAVERVVLGPGGKALSLELAAGESYAVVGPAQSLKGELMRVLRGGKPFSGSLNWAEPPAVPLDKEPGRRHTPQSLARAINKRVTGARLTQVLSALGLWDLRQTPVAQLPDELTASCDLLPVFLSDAPAGLIDGQLDQFDPWIRSSTLELVHESTQSGRSFIIATNLVTVAEAIGHVVVVLGQSPVFAGPIAELLRSSSSTVVTVETDDPSTVAAMVEPLSVSVSRVPEGIRFESDPGQELAARLLAQGYGRIRAMVVKEPTLADVLRSIV